MSPRPSSQVRYVKQDWALIAPDFFAHAVVETDIKKMEMKHLSYAMAFHAPIGRLICNGFLVPYRRPKGY